MSKITLEELQKSIAQSSADLVELLRKAAPDFDKLEDDKEEGEPSQDAAPAADAPSQDEAPAPDAPAPEGQEEQEGADEADELAQHVASMTDEDLQMLVEAVMAEAQKRKSAPAPEAQPAPQPEQAEKAMKDEYLKLTKSVEAMAKAIECLTKEVDTMRTQPMKKSISKAADFSSAQIVDKVAPTPARLTKSETVDAVLCAIRRNDPIADSRMMAQVNNCRTEEDLHKVQDMLRVKGIIK